MRRTEVAPKGAVMGTVILVLYVVASWTLHKSDGAQPESQVTEHSGYPSSPPFGEEPKRLRSLRDAGLHGDHSQLPAMVATLQHFRDEDHVRTTLHALSRLGNPAGLSAIDFFVQQNPQWAGEAKIARARLVAEASAGGIADNTSKVAAKVDRYYRELGLSPSDLNAGAAHYQPYRSDRTDSYTSPPTEVYAMRELADMMYRGPSEGAAGLPGIAQVDFSRDFPSLLKIRLAPMSQEQRLAWLINDLAHKTKMGSNERYELQLTSDGGIPASRLAIAKLWEMDKRRDEYKSTGFSALFNLLFSIRNPEQKAIITHLRQDRDPLIKQYTMWTLPHYQFVYDY